MNCLDLVPTQFRAGDTVRWSRYVADYLPSAGWTLHYRFTSAAGKFDVDAVASDVNYESVITATQSSPIASGSYAWVEYVTGGDSERYTLRQGSCTVLPNLAAQTSGTDQRSQAQRSLDAINAVLEGRATDGVEEYEIHGRHIKKMSVDELLSLRNHLQSVVNRENAAIGSRTAPRRVLTGFGRSC